MSADPVAVALAQEARNRAYCPYSGYAVGACVRAELDGRPIYAAGCNVENVSYGLCQCAERVAVGRLVSEFGKRSIEQIVVATRDGGTPCGACRQVLAEFGANECVVFCVDEEGAIQEYRLGELLPAGFRSDFVGPNP